MRENLKLKTQILEGSKVILFSEIVKVSLIELL
jgi:hypothetical protein